MLVWALAACEPPPDVPQSADSAEPELVPAWPTAQMAFHHPVLEVPDDFDRPGVFVVGGHGAPGNQGNLGCKCQREQDFTLDASADLARRLRHLGIFDVTQGRTGTRTPSYPSRLRHLVRSKADVLLELHSDARGGVTWWKTGQTEDGEDCWRTDDSPGVSVLVSDEGSAELAGNRLDLARAVATALSDAGFGMFELGYGDLYDNDSTPGVYVDRRGLMMLRRPTVPSILIETHNAFDGREVERWQEERTRDAFGRAITEALIDYFSTR
ncbi:MAG: N-acetylmuramoyl-L-alanine amidase [Myxococcales bacterium]|nr:N-acetylmuramoyl-L-alanine amidase [Myxococcales bacterium]